jgi:hypothetical protein
MNRLPYWVARMQRRPPPYSCTNTTLLRHCLEKRIYRNRNRGRNTDTRDRDRHSMSPHTSGFRCHCCTLRYIIPYHTHTTSQRHIRHHRGGPQDVQIPRHQLTASGQVRPNGASIGFLQPVPPRLGPPRDFCPPAQRLQRTFDDHIRKLPTHNTVTWTIKHAHMSIRQRREALLFKQLPKLALDARKAHAAVHPGRRDDNLPVTCRVLPQKDHDPMRFGFQPPPTATRAAVAPLKRRLQSRLRRSAE